MEFKWKSADDSLYWSMFFITFVENLALIHHTLTVILFLLQTIQSYLLILVINRQYSKSQIKSYFLLQLFEGKDTYNCKTEDLFFFFPSKTWIFLKWFLKSLLTGRSLGTLSLEDKQLNKYECLQMESGVYITACTTRVWRKQSRFIRTVTFNINV